jgi:hypothetical protein
VFGKGQGDLGACPRSGPIFLGNMGAQERWNDSTDTLTKSHDDWHEERTRKGACAQGKGHVGPRNEWLMGTQGLDGHPGSIEGHTDG